MARCRSRSRRRRGNCRAASARSRCRGSGRSGPGWPSPGPAVHQLVVHPGRAQDLDVLGPDPVRARAGHVGVLGRVLPLPHRDHGRGAGDGPGGELRGPALFVGAPQGGRAVDEAADAVGVRAVLARDAEPDVVEAEGPLQPPAQHLADQVGHLAAGALPLQPAGDRGVFVAQGESAGAARLVDVCGESGVGHARLGEEGVEQGVGLHGPLQGLVGIQASGCASRTGAGARDSHPV